ncbi:site-2 protease family protein [Thermococcus sp. AM4]|uniref:site-2 protease family protein n=1 Tax=Thermococcus sp. (strain AM4) TaxID=246969 RepID=UPI000187105E|nr:site-2 protease family protein [Thermococcus sp. AM4]EEB73316.1 zinc metalloprotease [Thermococcus sp. AM4]
MPKGIYECVNCGHREIIESNEALLEGACPKCGGDMVLVGFAIDAGEAPSAGEDLFGVEELVSRFYRAEFVEKRGEVYVFRVLEILERDFETVLQEFEGRGYWAALKRAGGDVVLYVFPAGEVKPDNPKVGIALFILTLLSTLWAGYVLAIQYIATLDQLGLPGYRNPYVIAVAFSLSVLAILGTHEMGHKIAATMHNVKATFPYFIPFPNLLGTLGAVIRVKSPVPTRNAAIDLGVSGPLAGILVAIPVTIIGLRLSPVVPASLVPSSGKGLYLGTNLFFTILEKLILSENVAGGDYVVFLHPVAIAGWVGILVTFLNLIPAAQLDGGHIARAFMSERLHRYFTIGIGLTLILMSYLWSGWMIWGLLVLFIGGSGNPGALDEVSPISWSRKALAILALIIFVLTATPVPFFVR